MGHDLEDEPMPTCVVEHVVFSDGPAVKTVGNLLSGLRKVVDCEDLQWRTFRNKCLPFSALKGKKFVQGVGK